MTSSQLVDSVRIEAIPFKFLFMDAIVSLGLQLFQNTDRISI